MTVLCLRMTFSTARAAGEPEKVDLEHPATSSSSVSSTAAEVPMPACSPARRSAEMLRGTLPAASTSMDQLHPLEPSALSAFRTRLSSTLAGSRAVHSAVPAIPHRLRELTTESVAPVITNRLALVF